MVIGLGWAKRDKAFEPSRDRVGVGDGARGRPGADVVHEHGTGGADGMRGDGVGVGDVSKVQGRTRKNEDAAGGDDGRGPECILVGGLVSEWPGHELYASDEPRGDGVGVGDGARGGPGAGVVHQHGTGGADGMRGDGVGVGDVGEVHSRTWRMGDQAGGDDGRREGRQCVSGIVSRFCFAKRYETSEPRADRLGFGDGARGRPGADVVHEHGTGGADGMRGDGVGVGHFNSVSRCGWFETIACCGGHMWHSISVLFLCCFIWIFIFKRCIRKCCIYRKCFYHSLRSRFGGQCPYYQRLFAFITVRV
jgi:hypothetical protein